MLKPLPTPTPTPTPTPKGKRGINPVRIVKCQKGQLQEIAYMGGKHSTSRVLSCAGNLLAVWWSLWASFQKYIILELPLWLHRLRTWHRVCEDAGVASLSGLRIWGCCKLWRRIPRCCGCGSQSIPTPSPGTSLCHKYRLKKIYKKALYYIVLHKKQLYRNIKIL